MGWSAGFGRAVITPPVPVMLAGFADRTEPAAAVYDDLEVRALYISDGGAGACLLVLDLLGLSDDIADTVRATVGDALGLPQEAVLTACTHTHHGPSTVAGGEKLGWTPPEGYAFTVVRGCLTAARAAREDSAPVTLGYVRAPLPDGISHNRRGLPYEPWFSALDIRRSGGGRAGVIANVSIHPVSLGSPWLAVSTDWVGPFRAALESAGGTAIALSGALGDINPVEIHTDLPTHLAEAPREAASIGERAALAVTSALERAGEVGGSLGVGSRTLTVPAEGTLADLLGLQTDTVELVEWTIGDVALVGVPGEAFHALGRAIEASRGDRALIAGLAPSWHGYLPVPWGDGYEEMVSLGERAVAQIAEALTTGARP